MLFTILNRGGAETMVMNYYRHIDRSRLQFDFLVHRSEPGAYEAEIRRLGGRIYRLMPLSPLTLPAYIRQVARFFDEHPGYRIVHGHCSELGYYIYREAARRHIPVIIAHAHNTCETFNLKLPFRTWLKHRMQPYLTHRFACGRDAAQYLFGAEGAKTAVMQHNAIDTAAFRFDPEVRKKVREELRLAPDELAVGHVGRFYRQKNHGFAVRVFEAFHRLRPRTKLLLVGEGDLMPHVRRQVEEAGLSGSVLFLGSRSDVPQLLSAMDMFLFPSQWEGLPVSFVEAQASGLPCLASDRVPREAALTDLVHFEPLGLAPAGWAARMESVAGLAADRTLYADRVAAAGYDIGSNAAWLQQLYMQLAEEGGEPCPC